MAPRMVGTVERISVYPLKSVLGFRPPRALASWVGLQCDREWVVVDGETSRVVTAKQVGGVPLLRVQVEPYPLEENGKTVMQYLVTVPPSRDSGGYERSVTEPCGSDELDFALTCLLGRRSVRVVRVGDEPLRTDAGFDLKPRSGADSSPLHIVTTASLDVLSEHHPLHPGRDELVARLRPSLVIETEDVRPYAELGWGHLRLKIGSSVICVIRKPTERCALPTRPQMGLAADPAILRSMSQLTPRGFDLPTFGVYASIAEPGVIEEGAPVMLL
jgi:uncharacterized protein YcbX